MNPTARQWARWQERLTAGGATLLLILLFSCLYGYHYEMNDDILIKDILSGSYTGTPSGYCIQMLYPIGVIVAFLYRIFRSVPWFGLLLIFFQYGACYLIFDRSLHLLQRTARKLLILWVEVLLFGTYFAYWFVNLQYSMTCAFLTAAAMFLFVTTDAECTLGEFLSRNVGTALLLVTAFCIRTEMMLLLSPFLAFARFSYWIYRDRKNKRDFWKSDSLLRFGGFLAILALGLLLVWGVDCLAYRSGDWAGFRRLFDSRTQVYDFYGVPGYDGNEAFYEEIGLGEAGQVLLENYNYLFAPQVDAELFDEVVRYDRDALQIGYLKVALKQGLLDYRYWHAGQVSGSILRVVACLYLIVIGLGILDKRWSVLWEAPFLYVVRSVLWLYLILRGRYPERIIYGLLLMEISCLLYLLIRHLAGRSRPVTELLTRVDQDQRMRRNDRRDLGINIGIAAVLSISMLLALPDLHAQLTKEKEERDRINTEWQSLQDYTAERSSDLYLLDIYSTVRYSERVWSGDRNRLKNYDYAGGWACKSPLQRQKLSGWGLEQFPEDMIDSPGVFWISYTERDAQWLVQWYEAQGKAVRLVPVDQFGKDTGDLFSVYRIEGRKD